MVPAKAEDLARHLGGGRKSGKQWLARCPAHDDRTPSLSIGYGYDGRIVFHCHAGCSQQDVLHALVERGLWSSDGSKPRLIASDQFRAAEKKREAKTAELVKRVWTEGRDPRGTVAEEYLAARALCLSAELCGSVLRFHPACVWEGGTVPALLAAFRSISSDKLTGLHRVRLDRPERWPKAERRMLGAIGGSAVKLDASATSLAIAEGIESALAGRELGFSPIWAVGSAVGIANFMPLDGVERLTILGENDSGTNAKAARQCRENWKECHVSIVTPRRDCKDANDVLLLRRGK
jgi:hypothetical protein